MRNYECRSLGKFECRYCGNEVEPKNPIGSCVHDECFNEMTRRRNVGFCVGCSKNPTDEERIIMCVDCYDSGDFVGYPRRS